MSAVPQDPYAWPPGALSRIADMCWFDAELDAARYKAAWQSARRRAAAERQRAERLATSRDARAEKVAEALHEAPLADPEAPS